MITWTQADRFESTVTTSYNGIQLRVQAEIANGMGRARGLVFAQRPGEPELQVGGELLAESLDDALEAGKEVAIAFANQP